MKKILVLYTSVGLGHKYIAENIGYHLQQGGYEVHLHDILQVQEGMMVDFGIWLHSFINRRLPFVWRWLYFSNLVNLISLPLRVPLAKSNSENLLKIVNEFKPDCILSTQTTASAAVASLIEQKKFSGKFIIAFSDYHLHKFWLYDQADLYLVNIEEQKQEMIKLGVDANKIVVCGITLRPLEPIAKQVIKNNLGLQSEADLDEKEKIVIFGSGSLGIGFDTNLLKSYLAKLIEQNSDINIFVMCGKNTNLKHELDSLSLPKVHALGFYKNPSELYQVGDVLLTKPGGLTIAEALQAGIKIQITHTLPGQEEPNYEYLLKNKLVAPVPQPLTADNLVSATIKLLNSDEPTSETVSAEKITLAGQEGKILKESINKLFGAV